MAHDFQILLFLIQLKEAVNAGRFTVIPREENQLFLAKYGMMAKERENIILGLKTSDYKSGPEEDRDFPGEKDIWKFRSDYMGIEIYIKVKLLSPEGGFYGKCLSFHD